MRKNGKISVLIPVREGSSRCKHKNFRPFGDTNLLELKVIQMKELKKMGLIDEIIVNTSSKKMLKIARDLGVTAVERDPHYSHTESTPTEVTRCVSSSVKNPIMLYVHCVAPFSKNEDAIEMIKIFRNDTEHTAVASANIIKKQMWLNGKSLNFSGKIPQTQLLPDVMAPTYGFTIIETELALAGGSLFGDNPYFYKVDDLSSIDIDTPLDFTIAELIYKAGIRKEEDVTKYMSPSS